MCPILQANNIKASIGVRWHESINNEGNQARPAETLTSNITSVETPTSRVQLAVVLDRLSRVVAAPA